MHWLIRYDPVNGDPYGELCNCPLDDDHTADATPEETP